MESFLIDLLFSSLIAVTLTFSAVIVPFAGAVWIYKKTSLSVAESKIFEVGREIAIALQEASDIRPPFSPTFYTYIDDAISEVGVPNRDAAIGELIKRTGRDILFHAESDDFDMQAASNLLLAIAADRFSSLVPPGVMWSGHGSLYSTFGEDIVVEDNFFPFGTKLYRKWVERFGLIHKDLWFVTSAHGRKCHSENLRKGQNPEQEFVVESDVNAWLDSVQALLRRVNALHSRLVTQIQTIDSNIDIAGFRSSLLVSGVFLVLLLVSGYFVPRVLIEIGEGSWANLSLLFSASALLMSRVGIRLVHRFGQERDTDIQRRMYIPPLLAFLDEVRPRYLRFKGDRVDNIISLKDELGLSKNVCELLGRCSAEMKRYNEAANEYSREVRDLIPFILGDFPCVRNSKGGFSVSLAEIASKSCDHLLIEKRIMSERNNLFFSLHEQHRTREIYTIDLSVLSDSRRKELVGAVQILRQKVGGLASYRSLSECWSGLERTVSLLKESSKRLLPK